MAETFCVMNIAKRKRCDVRGLQDEANRTADKYKNDVDLSRSKDNIYLVRSDDWHEAISEALEENELQYHEKSDSVVLITTVYTFSPEWLESHTTDEMMSYFKDCLEYERRKGKTISAVIHMDETTPHLQVATVPIVDVPNEVCKPITETDEDGNELTDEDGNPIYSRYKTGKSKGKVRYRREKEKDASGNIVTHKGLNAKYVIGNKVKMSKEQTAFWECCGKPYGMQRGKIRVIDDEEAKDRKDEATFAAAKIIEDAKIQAATILKTREEELDAREHAQNEREAFLDNREAKIQARDEKSLRTQSEASEKLKRVDSLLESLKSFGDSLGDVEDIPPSVMDLQLRPRTMFTDMTGTMKPIALYPEQAREYKTKRLVPYQKDGKTVFEKPRYVRDVVATVKANQQKYNQRMSKIDAFQQIRKTIDTDRSFE